MWYPSTFLYSNKVESTIHRLRRSPFLSRKEHRFSCFPLISFRMLALCKKRTFRFTPAICKDCTDPGRRLTVWIIKITVKFRDRLGWIGSSEWKNALWTVHSSTSRGHFLSGISQSPGPILISRQAIPWFRAKLGWVGYTGPKKMVLGLYKVVRPRAIFWFGIS